MADTHNIYQRAIDIFNKHVEPDISQGGGGGSGPKYMHNIGMQALSKFNQNIQFGESDTRTCNFLVTLQFKVEFPFEDEITEFRSLSSLIRDGYIKNPVIGRVEVVNSENTEETYTTFPIVGVGYSADGKIQIHFHYAYYDWSKGQINYSYSGILETDQMMIRDMVEEM